MFFTRYVLTKNSLSLRSRRPYHALCQRVCTSKPKILALNPIRYTKSLPPPIKLSAGQKLKNAVKDYGSVVIVFHVTISLISLGGFCLLVYSGFDIHTIIDLMGLNIDDQTISVAGGATKFVIAYAIHKAFAPIRISITLVSVPFVVKYLRRIGFLKTLPKK